MGAQGDDQVKGDADAGQVCQIRGAVRPRGIDDGDGIFGQLSNRMMIGDDGIDAVFAGQADGLGAAGAAVGGNDQLRCRRSGPAG
jgi:hypothetical protein